MTRPAPGGPLAIEARDLHKAFLIPNERQTMLKERVLNPGTWLRGEGRRLEALRGVSFDVHRGEFFGVVGRNGCGKSTLLKLLASIYRVDRGSVRVAGRLAPFIELGVGFNLELPARDNVVLNGVMMGLSPADARSRFDQVVDYAELREYTDLKLKNYSMGMQVRLAFSMMLEADADVLLVDEVLAVGDLAFQEKCIASLEELKGRGTTIVFVTHDMEAVRSHCDRAMLIEDGLVEQIGAPDQLTERFMEVILPRTGTDVDAGRSEARVAAAWLTGADGRAIQEAGSADPVTVNATVSASRPIPALELELELTRYPEGTRLGGFSVGRDGEIPALEAGQEATVRVAIDGGSLEPGEYRVAYALSRPAEGESPAPPSERPSGLLDRSSDPLRLRVHGEAIGGGGVAIPHRVSVERGRGQVGADAPGRPA